MSWLTLNNGFYIETPQQCDLSISGYACECGADILGAEVLIYNSNQSLVFSNNYADDQMGDEWFNEELCLTTGCYEVAVFSEYFCYNRCL